MIQTLSGREFPAVVKPLIENAKQSIDIVVYAWRWYPSDPGAVCQLFNQAIVQAARRGVKVRAILNDNKTIAALQSLNIDSKKLDTDKIMHAKLIIIDENIVITGSHNYTQFVFQTNLELSVLLSGENIGSGFRDFFNNLWKLK